MSIRSIRGHSAVLALSLSLLVAGAFPPAAPAEDQGQPSGTEQATDLETLQKEWGQAVDALRSYSAEQRDEALAEAEEQLAVMDRRIDALESRFAEEWAGLGESARRQREQALHGLREQRRELAEWYGGMKHGSRNAWEDVKQGFVRAYGALAESFGKAVEEFRSEPGDGE